MDKTATRKVGQMLLTLASRLSNETAAALTSHHQGTISDEELAIALLDAADETITGLQRETKKLERS